MNGSSNYLSALMTIFVLLACLGLYLLIDARSLAKLQAADAQKSLDRVAQLLERGVPLAAAPSAPPVAASSVDGETLRAVERLHARLDRLESALLARGAAASFPVPTPLPSTTAPGGVSFAPRPTATGNAASPSFVPRVVIPFAVDATRMEAMQAALREGVEAVDEGLVEFLPSADGRSAMVAARAGHENFVVERLRPFAVPALPDAPSNAKAAETPDAPGFESTSPVAAPDTAPKQKIGFANDAYRDPDAVPGDERVGYTMAFPGNLNQLVENEAFAGAVMGYCVAPLAERDLMDVTRYEPVMAESWTVSDDGLVYTIRLREGFRWQAYTDPVTQTAVPARPVTAHDFAFFWEILGNPDIPCDFLRGYYKDIESVEAVDDRTFRVVWREPYSLSEDFTLGLSPWPRHFYRPDPTVSDADFARAFVTSPRNAMVVGTGPYRLQRWDPAKELVLVRDPDYAGPRPALERIVYRLIQDPEIALLELKTGRLDAMGLMPVQWHNQTPSPQFQLVTPDAETAVEDSAAFDDAKKNGTAPTGHDYEKFQYDGNAWTYIGYNMRRPLFADRTVRRALTQLIDRPRIMREVLLGLARPISGPFVPRSPYYDHAVEPWPFDPEQAQALLREAGWEDSDGDGFLDRDYDGSGERKPFAFTLMIAQNNPNYRKIAALIEQDLRAVGIRMSTRPLEWSVFLQQIDKYAYDACILGWTGGIEGDPYQIWHSESGRNEGGSNHVGYFSAEADALIEKGRRTLDKAERYGIYQAFHRLLHEDQPYTFLYAPMSTVAQHRRYFNARVYRNGMSPELQWVPVALRSGRL